MVRGRQRCIASIRCRSVLIAPPVRVTASLDGLQAASSVDASHGRAHAHTHTYARTCAHQVVLLSTALPMVAELSEKYLRETGLVGDKAPVRPQNVVFCVHATEKVRVLQRMGGAVAIVDRTWSVLDAARTPPPRQALEAAAEDLYQAADAAETGGGLGVLPRLADLILFNPDQAEAEGYHSCAAVHRSAPPSLRVAHFVLVHVRERVSSRSPSAPTSQRRGATTRAQLSIGLPPHGRVGQCHERGQATRSQMHEGNLKAVLPVCYPALACGSLVRRIGPGGRGMGGGALVPVACEGAALGFSLRTHAHSSLSLSLSLSLSHTHATHRQTDRQRC